LHICLIAAADRAALGFGTVVDFYVGGNEHPRHLKVAGIFRLIHGAFEL